LRVMESPCALCVLLYFTVAAEFRLMFVLLT